MPREGVPYPERLLCSVRCELKNIWNALNGKLHSVNGVEGDGQGNVDIVSGDAAVVVTPQPLSNQIEISLDQSQLPAAAVTSVNNATGAVHLIGADIRTGVYSPGNSATQDISTARASISGVNQNVTAEATARQNADSALQNNINNVTASLPGAAAAAVAADPTIAQLVVDMNDKVDVSDVAINETPNTIAKRNGSGRLVAADPASGATDKTLVTANWVSQTGDSAPNNLIHKSGNETKSGNLTFLNDSIRKINRDMTFRPSQYVGTYPKMLTGNDDKDIIRYRLNFDPINTSAGWQIYNSNNQGTIKSIQLVFAVNHTNGNCSLQLITSTNSFVNLATWTDTDLIDS